MDVLTLICVYVCILFSYVKSYEQHNLTYTSVIELQDMLLQNYSKDFRPVEKQGEKVVIAVVWELDSINGFHEVTGELVTSSRFTTVWRNELMRWNLSAYNAPYIILNSENLWNPALALDNPTGNTDMKKAYEKGTIRCTSEGHHFFSVSVRTSTICEPDMGLYPFDRHNCTIKIVSPDYYLKEVELVPTAYTDISALVVVSQWKVISLYGGNDDTPSTSRLAFGVVFQRKPAFIILNLLTPIVFLCFLNLAVFILPPQSGERMSFSVTMFLSFSVYMTLISEKLPVTNPVSTFTQYLVCNVAYSALILFSTVVGLRFHLVEDKGERIPVCVERLVRLLSCNCSKCTKSSSKTRPEIKDNDTDVVFNITSTDKVNTSVKFRPKISINYDDAEIDNDVDCSSRMLKKDFGKTLDKFCLASFLLLLVTGNAFFLLYIALS